MKECSFTNKADAMYWLINQINMTYRTFFDLVCDTNDIHYHDLHLTIIESGPKMEVSNGVKSFLYSNTHCTYFQINGSGVGFILTKELEDKTTLTACMCEKSEFIQRLVDAYELVYFYKKSLEQRKKDLLKNKN